MSAPTEPVSQPGPSVSKTARGKTTSRKPLFSTMPRISSQPKNATHQYTYPVHHPPQPPPQPPPPLHGIPPAGGPPPPAHHWMPSPLPAGQNFYPYYPALPFGPSTTPLAPWSQPSFPQHPQHPIVPPPHPTTPSHHTGTQDPTGTGSFDHATHHVLTLLASAQYHYEQAWAMTEELIHAEHVRLHQLLTDEQEAHRRTLARLGRANRERERLDAETAKAVDDCNRLKTNLRKLVADAFKSAIAQLVSSDSSTDADAMTYAKLLTPEVVAKMSAMIDAAVCDWLAGVPPTDPSTPQPGESDVPEQPDPKAGDPPPSLTPPSAPQIPTISPTRSHKRQRIDSQEYTLKPCSWTASAPNATTASRN